VCLVIVELRAAKASKREQKARWIFYQKTPTHYQWTTVDWVKVVCGWMLEIVKRSDDIKGFKVLPHRWVVERTFGWLGRYRRLSKDYEGLTESSQAFIYAAMIHIMIRRLARIKTSSG